MSNIYIKYSSWSILFESGKYLQCDNHVEYEKDCPQDLWFHFEAQVSQ